MDTPGEAQQVHPPFLLRCVAHDRQGAVMIALDVHVGLDITLERYNLSIGSIVCGSGSVGCYGRVERRLCRGLDGRRACVGCCGVLGGWARRTGVHGIFQQPRDVQHARVCVSIPVPRAMREVLVKYMVCTLLAVHSLRRVGGVLDDDTRPRCKCAATAGGDPCAYKSLVTGSLRYVSYRRSCRRANESWLYKTHGPN